ncbi:hypothetical protein BJX64DRAFT_23690 [Aspergillus heterothallicus]
MKTWDLDDRRTSERDWMRRESLFVSFASLPIVAMHQAIIFKDQTLDDCHKDSTWICYGN